MTKQAPHKVGHVMRLNVVNGVPLCPVHGDPLMEAEGGWRCADAVAVDAVLRSTMLAALDAAMTTIEESA